MKEVFSLPIPLPPLAEQKRIVATLDAAFEGIDSAIDKAEQNQANARLLFEASLVSEFSSAADRFRSAPISKYVSIKHGFAFKGADFERSMEVDLPIVLTPGNFTEDGTLHFDARNTKRFKSKFSSDLLLQKGSLTVIMTDLSSNMKILGKPAFVDRDDVLHNQRIGLLEFRSPALAPRYLYHFLMSPFALRHIRAGATGTMVRHTAPRRILAISLPVPHLEDQARIANRLDEVQARSIELVQTYRNKTKKLRRLKQSLLDSAFLGKLTGADGSTVATAAE